MRNITSSTTLFMDAGDTVSLKGISTGLQMVWGGNDTVFVHGINDSLTFCKTGNDIVYDDGRSLNLIADELTNTVTVFGAQFDHGFHITINPMQKISSESSDGHGGTFIQLVGNIMPFAGTIHVVNDAHVAIV